ncbi:hypothetical protein, partial, partial [Absidia glauca]
MLLMRSAPDHWQRKYRETMIPAIKNDKKDFADVMNVFVAMDLPSERSLQLDPSVNCSYSRSFSGQRPKGKPAQDNVSQEDGGIPCGNGCGAKGSSSNGKRPYNKPYDKHSRSAKRSGNNGTSSSRHRSHRQHRSRSRSRSTRSSRSNSPVRASESLRRSRYAPAEGSIEDI